VSGKHVQSDGSGGPGALDRSLLESARELHGENDAKPVGAEAKAASGAGDLDVVDQLAVILLLVVGAIDFVLF
jgi:hypothetical protein